MKYSIILLTFFLLNNSYGSRRGQIIKIIDSELKEIAKVLGFTGEKERPKLLVKMSELYQEKARLLREEENIAFLKIPSRKRSSRVKTKMFKRSENFYKKSAATARLILRKYPRAEEISKAYYILAFFYYDRKKNNQAKRYFKLALKSSVTKSKIRAHAERALGELYFEDRKYKDAIKLYEDGLENHQASSRTKMLFNLAWSHWKVDVKKKAISRMKEVIELSKQEKYVDYRKQAIESLVQFYVNTNPQEGIAYFESIDESFFENLVAMATDKSTNKDLRKFLLESAIELVSDPKGKAKVYIGLLDYYGSINHYSKHLKTAKKIKKLEKGSWSRG